MTFAVAQTFLIDPEICKKSSQVTITEIQLYFRAKPRITGNKSGIFSPGVNVGLVPTRFGIPLIGQTGLETQVVWARQEWGSIHVTADASMSTRFRFTTPQSAYTGAQYAIIVKYDGDEDFLIWTNKTGDNLVGTTNPSPGTSGRYIGSLYTYISALGTLTGTGVGYSDSTLTSNSIVIPSISSQVPSSIQLSQEYLLSAWRPIDNTDLKFKVAVARYFHNGVPVTANTSITGEPSIIIWGIDSSNYAVTSNNVLRLTAPSSPIEFISYNKASSEDDPLSFGEIVYQDQPFWSGGKNPAIAPATVAVTNGSLIATGNAAFVLSNGANFSWNQIYSTNKGTIVVTSLNHDGSGLHRVNIRSVTATNSNILAVSEPFTFTNATAKFFAAPKGRLTSKLRSYGAGGSGNNAGKMADIIILSDTSANSTCRFVNNCIDTITIGTPGLGYNNADVLTINGFENVTNEVYGGYAAKANIVTSATGAIIAVNLTNVGCGFVNSSWITGANVVLTTSAGHDAVLTYTYNTTLKTESSGGTSYFKGCSVINLDALQIVPLIDLNNPSGTTYSITNRTLYHSNNSTNTFSKKRYTVNDNATLTDFTIQNGKLHNYSPNLIPTIVSRSNQYSIRYADGSVPSETVIGATLSNNACYFFDVASNNDFCAISFGAGTLVSTYARYIINNDYTKEETNYGNAWAKHVTSKINFADGREAEDLLVYLTAYRPSGTDFKVYARIYNSLDDDAFESKDWTLMEQTDGLGVYSNPNNPADMKEFTYNFPAFPNTDTINVVGGAVTTVKNSNNIVGIGTLFNTKLAANDLVRIYQPLFPNNYMISVVGTVSSATNMYITAPVANDGMVGDSLKIDRIAFPHQAFNDTLNSNVVCYHNSNMVRFDTYDTFQLKVIFLSNNDNVIPKIDDIRAVGVSA